MATKGISQSTQRSVSKHQEQEFVGQPNNKREKGNIVTTENEINF